MEKKFAVLYTHQKQKKAKTWYDGILKHLGAGTKAVLFDEKGCRLDSIHVRVEDIQLGEQLESDRYYILVEELQVQPSTTQQSTTVSMSQTSLKPQFRAMCAGVKKRKGGFMPPRMTKQLCPVNNQDYNQGSPNIPSQQQSDSYMDSDDSKPALGFSPRNSMYLSDTNKTSGGNYQEQTHSDINPSPNRVNRKFYVLNMYSRLGKGDSWSDTEHSSEVSDQRTGHVKLMSPWSVYGSRTCSPDVKTWTAGPGQQDVDVVVSRNGTEHENEFHNAAQQTRFQVHEMEHSTDNNQRRSQKRNSVLMNTGNSNERYDDFPEVDTAVLGHRVDRVKDTGINLDYYNEKLSIGKTRSMSQIMNLIRRRPASPVLVNQRSTEMDKLKQMTLPENPLLVDREISPTDSVSAMVGRSGSDEHEQTGTFDSYSRELNNTKRCGHDSQADSNNTKICGHDSQADSDMSGKNPKDPMPCSATYEPCKNDTSNEKDQHFVNLSNKRLCTSGNTCIGSVSEEVTDNGLGNKTRHPSMKRVVKEKTYMTYQTKESFVESNNTFSHESSEHKCGEQDEGYNFEINFSPLSNVSNISGKTDMEERVGHTDEDTNCIKTLDELIQLPEKDMFEQESNLKAEKHNMYNQDSCLQNDETEIGVIEYGLINCEEPAHFKNQQKKTNYGSPKSENVEIPNEDESELGTSNVNEGNSVVKMNLLSDGQTIKQTQDVFVEIPPAVITYNPESNQSTLPAVNTCTLEDDQITLLAVNTCTLEDDQSTLPAVNTCTPEDNQSTLPTVYTCTPEDNQSTLPAVNTCTPEDNQNNMRLNPNSQTNLNEKDGSKGIDILDVIDRVREKRDGNESDVKWLNEIGAVNRCTEGTVSGCISHVLDNNSESHSVVSRVSSWSQDTMEFSCGASQDDIHILQSTNYIDFPANNKPNTSAFCTTSTLPFNESTEYNSPMLTNEKTVESKFHTQDLREYKHYQRSGEITCEQYDGNNTTTIATCANIGRMKTFLERTSACRNIIDVMTGNTCSRIPLQPNKTMGSEDKSSNTLNRFKPRLQRNSQEQDTDDENPFAEVIKSSVKLSQMPHSNQLFKRSNSTDRKNSFDIAVLMEKENAQASLPNKMGSDVFSHQVPDVEDDRSRNTQQFTTGIDQGHSDTLSTDDDIYTQLYRPRLMYNINIENMDNTTHVIEHKKTDLTLPSIGQYYALEQALMDKQKLSRKDQVDFSTESIESHMTVAGYGNQNKLDRSALLYAHSETELSAIENISRPNEWLKDSPTDSECSRNRSLKSQNFTLKSNNTIMPKHIATNSEPATYHVGTSLGDCTNGPYIETTCKDQGTLSKWEDQSTLSKWEDQSTWSKWEDQSTLSKWEDQSTLSKWEDQSTLSKWEMFAESQNSDDLELDLNIQNTHFNGKKDFSVVEKSPSLFCTQFSKSTNHQVNKQFECSMDDSKFIISGCYEVEIENSESAMNNVKEKNTTNQMEINPETKSQDFCVLSSAKSSQCQIPDSFTSVDSFETLLIHSDFDVTVTQNIDKANGHEIISNYKGPEKAHTADTVDILNNNFIDNSEMYSIDNNKEKFETVKKQHGNKCECDTLVPGINDGDVLKVRDSTNWEKYIAKENSSDSVQNGVNLVCKSNDMFNGKVLNIQVETDNEAIMSQQNDFPVSDTEWDEMEMFDDEGETFDSSHNDKKNVDCDRKTFESSHTDKNVDHDRETFESSHTDKNVDHDRETFESSHTDKNVDHDRETFESSHTDKNVDHDRVLMSSSPVITDNETFSKENHLELNLHQTKHAVTMTIHNHNDWKILPSDSFLDEPVSFTETHCEHEEENHEHEDSVKEHMRKVVSVMRKGWKSPVKAVINNTNNTTSSSCQLQKIKPTFKCLSLLKKATVETHVTNISNTSVENIHTNPQVPTNIPSPVQNLSYKCVSRRSGETPKKVYSGEINSPLSSAQTKCCSSNVGTHKDTRPISNQRFKNMVPNKRFKAPIMYRSFQKTYVPKISSPSISDSDVSVTSWQTNTLSVSSTELRFPTKQEVERGQSVIREVCIPPTFPSVGVYKQVLTAAITEYVNCQLYDVAKKYHQALSKVDISGYSQSKTSGSVNLNLCSSNPVCKCGIPSKTVMVKKEGPNKNRCFFACSASRNQQCKFFQWADKAQRDGFGCMSGSKRRIHDVQMLNLYMKDQHIHLYGETQFVKRTSEKINRYFKAPKYARAKADAEPSHQKQILLKLPYKEYSSLYAKDDLWVVSQQLEFDSGCTFLARSTFYGPSSSLEVQIEPLAGYTPSKWQSGVVCHAILVGNGSLELSCMDNIRDHIKAGSPAVLSHLLNKQIAIDPLPRNSTSAFNAPRTVQNMPSCDNIFIPSDQMGVLVRQYIEQYELNIDQAEALRRVANMFTRGKSQTVDSVLLIHGVFGAGKSFLLSVMVLFLVEVFHMNDSMCPQQLFPWKLLISSTTNVAVDRVLIGLLNLGFEDFVRVGSVKKIAKPVLPFSVHASGTDSQELKTLQEMLRSGELTTQEKRLVRQSIEKHRHGENKKKLSRVRVVGVTCASCSLACLDNMNFPLVMLDECSQMTEPASLLPVARFNCHKLLLVGDPKQLDPTIQGAECAHQSCLEQTLFDRLIKMGSVPTLLGIQYRCHPHISAVANCLFYGGMIQDGVSDTDRKPLLDVLPTLCCFDVARGEECCEGAGSYYNEKEAQFVVFLIQVLLSSDIEASHIGVITLYRAQKSRITGMLSTCSDDMELKGVQVSTVDAFQGAERDIIILSTVRTNNCGFIDNYKRTNVALTRARHHLLIVGNLRNLSHNQLWGKIVTYCKGHDNGVQCADEARQTLEICMQSPTTRQTNSSVKENNKKNSEHSSDCKQSSKRELKHSRKTTARKRKAKTLEEFHMNSDSEDFMGTFMDSNGINGENVPEVSKTKKAVKRKRKNKTHDMFATGTVSARETCQSDSDTGTAMSSLTSHSPAMSLSQKSVMSDQCSLGSCPVVPTQKRGKYSSRLPLFDSGDTEDG